MENLNKVVKEIKIVAKPAKRGGKITSSAWNS